MSSLFFAWFLILYYMCLFQRMYVDCFDVVLSPLLLCCLFLSISLALYDAFKDRVADWSW